MRFVCFRCVCALYICLLSTGSGRKSSIQKQIDKIDDYFRDAIYDIRKKLQFDSKEREFFIIRLNKSLEYIETWRGEIDDFLSDNQCSGHSDAISSTSVQELSNKVDILQRGLATEKKIRISNLTKIAAHVDDIEENQRNMTVEVCKIKECLNGGVCIRQGDTERCLCTAGYYGEECEDSLVNEEEVVFSVTPESRDLVRGSSHIEECQAKQSDGRPISKYTWTLNATTIAHYNKDKGFGAVPGGLLRIDSFSEMMVGVYTCSAETINGTKVDVVFEYILVENCPVEIEVEPQNTQTSIGGYVLLECYSPDADLVVWKKEGQKIDFGREFRIKQMVNGYLYIPKVEELDGGIYRCEVSLKTRCYSAKEIRLTVLKQVPLSRYCGQTKYDEEISTRISSGKTAKPGEYPWHVLFRASEAGSTERTFASGSLISSKWVLTSSAVVEGFRNVFHKDFDATLVKLYIGTTRCDGVGGLVRTPTETVVHGDAVERAFMNNDLALIKLDTPVEYTDSVRPVCIEPSSFNDAYFFGKQNRLVYGKVSGCGLNWRHKESSELMAVQLPYVQRNECEEMFEEQRSSGLYRGSQNLTLTENMICAGHDTKRKGDSCEGDTGGALVMHAQNRWVQTGIVSFGAECDRGNPGVYTNVGQYFNWIKENTKFDQEYVPTTNTA